MWTLLLLAGFASAGPLSDRVDQALDALEQAEVAQAMWHLTKADEALRGGELAATRDDLLAYYHALGLTHLVRDDQLRTTDAAMRALWIDPSTKPEDRHGPAYAKVFKAVKKGARITMVKVRVVGDGTVRVSGAQAAGGDILKVPRGEHVVQILRGQTWETSVRQLDDGSEIPL